MTEKLFNQDANEVFNELYHLDVNDKVEKKGNLNYLSWAWAWGKVKDKYPLAEYRVERFGEDKKPYLLDEDLGYMIFTQVTIEGLTHEMWLPVMDHKNNAMKNKSYTMTQWKKEIEVQAASMFDINSSIMRCLVKNLAMFGLGLYIYAGEDLPEQPPAKKVSESQIRTLNVVIESIAQLIGKTPAEAQKTMLEHQGLPDRLEDLNVDQHGTFLRYMNGIQNDMEKKAKAKKKVEPAPADDTEQDSLFEGNSTKVKK